MSTVGEVVAARQAGLDVLVLSLITNAVIVTPQRSARDEVDKEVSTRAYGARLMGALGGRGRGEEESRERKGEKTDAFDGFALAADPWRDHRRDRKGGGLARGSVGGGNEEGCGGWKVGGESRWDLGREILDGSARVYFGTLRTSVEFIFLLGYHLVLDSRESRAGGSISRAKRTRAFLSPPSFVGLAVSPPSRSLTLATNHSKQTTRLISDIAPISLLLPDLSLSILPSLPSVPCACSSSSFSPRDALYSSGSASRRFHTFSTFSLGSQEPPKVHQLTDNNDEEHPISFSIEGFINILQSKTSYQKYGTNELSDFFLPSGEPFRFAIVSIRRRWEEWAAGTTDAIEETK